MTVVYEDNWPAFDLFTYMGTQWNIGMGGATGLKYEVAHGYLDRRNLAIEDYENRMDDLRIMEATALEVMRESRAKER